MSWHIQRSTMSQRLTFGLTGTVYASPTPQVGQHLTIRDEVGHATYLVVRVERDMQQEDVERYMDVVYVEREEVDQ